MDPYFAIPHLAGLTSYGFMLSLMPQQLTRSSWLRAPLVAAGFVLPFASLTLIASAQDKPAPEPSEQTGLTVEEELLRTRSEELAKARAEQQRAVEAEQKLRREIEALGADRRQLNSALIEAAAKIRDAEERMNEIEDRLHPLEANEAELRESLHERRGEISEILAAMQRAGRRPPPALLVSPEDAMKSVRSAIALGTMVPQMREKAERLADELAILAQLRSGIERERTLLAAEVEKLTQDQQRMTQLIEERQKTQAETENLLAAERQIAADMAQQVESLSELVARLEQGVSGAKRASLAALQSDLDQKDGSKRDLSAANDPGRLTPAIAFADARGRLPMPVNGVKIRNFGASDRQGGTEKGISIATRAGAQITSPSDGWVLYAGPFRSYGQVLILNVGGGYHVVLAGMERTSVDIGQFVLAGEPIAVMGSGTAQVAAAGPIGTKQPMLYIEFRKDGIPIDPGPWWATNKSEKVRG